MAIISGRNGQVLWDPAGTTPVEMLSLNAWVADFKTEYEDVTCFGDVNRVYIPGMKDAGGTLGGFFNSAELALFEAAEQDTPGLLKLVPSRARSRRSSGRGRPTWTPRSMRVCQAPKVSRHVESGRAVLTRGRRVECARRAAARARRLGQRRDADGRRVRCSTR